MDNIKRCANCKFYQPTTIFELCTAEESVYIVEGRAPDYHTIGHMLKYGCGSDMRLFRLPTTRS